MSRSNSRSLSSNDAAAIDARDRDNCLYPAFYDASKYVSDETWFNIIVDASKGKTPTGFSIIEGKSLVFRKRVGTRVVHNRIELPDNPLQLAEAFISFVKTNVHIYSVKDNEVMRQESEMKYNTRKTKKGIRDSDIDDYVRICRKMNNLTPRQTNCLAACIRLGVSLKVLIPYIIMNGDSIASIDHIMYNSSKDTFFIDPSIVNVMDSKQDVVRTCNIPTSSITGKRSKIYLPCEDVEDVDLTTILGRGGRM